MNILTAIIATLNEIEVKGKDNLDKLLGSIQALEELDAALTNEPNKKEETDNG